MAENQQIKIKLSSNQEIKYKIGDREGTAICDYMNCDFVCSPNTDIDTTTINNNTYGEHFVKMNYNAIAKRIRDVFREQTFYKREHLLASIQIMKGYPDEQIDYVLSMFTENPHNYIVDKYGRNGYLINTGDYYGFQPVEITNEHASIYDRSAPVDYKPAEMYMALPLKKEGVHDKPTQVLDVDRPMGVAPTPRPSVGDCCRCGVLHIRFVCNSHGAPLGVGLDRRMGWLLAFPTSH